jgi:hypothetical protein
VGEKSGQGRFGYPAACILRLALTCTEHSIRAAKYQREVLDTTHRAAHGFRVDKRQTGSNPFHPSRGPPAAILPVFPRRFQLSIPLGLNLLLMPGEHVLRRDVADGAVQTNVVVMLGVTLNQTPCIFQRQRRARADALPFERFVPPFDFAVRLRVIG